MTTIVHPSPLDWVRSYRQRRRKELGSEETFPQHVRRLWAVSGFAKHRRWTTEALEQALVQVADEPVPEPPTTVKPAPTIRTIRPIARKRLRSSPRPLTPRPVQPLPDQATCKDCGPVLPGWRRCGRCEPCRLKRARITARERKRRQRKLGLVDMSRL